MGWSIGLDRVAAVEPGRGARAVCNVPGTLAIFQTHFPRFPVLPGVLILDSLGELSALLLERQTGGVWRMRGARDVRFRHFVVPGDQMELRVELSECARDAACLHGSAWVDRKLVVSVRELRLAPVESGPAA